MEIDRKLAASLGFPKPHYLNVERERRWLCRSVPDDLVMSVEQITDLYVTGTQLRLRQARPIDGSPAQLRISRKVDADAQTRLISSIYLTEADCAALASALDGVKIVKLRHRLRGPSHISMCIDEFRGPLSGLLIVEAEFQDDEALGLFSPPHFAGREITEDPRYCGYALAMEGLPSIDDVG